MEDAQGTKKKNKILTAIKKRGNDSAVVDVEDNRSQFVIFRICDSFYAFKGHDVREILNLAEINHVPGSPDYILGIINVRGNIESVISINTFLGLQNDDVSECKRIIVADNGEVCSGILVKNVEDVLDLPEKIVHEPISTLTDEIKHYVEGEFDHKGRVVVLLNIDRVFGKICEPGRLG